MEKKSDSSLILLAAAFTVYTLREMANNRLFYITLIFAAAGLGMASFLAEVAVTEYERVQIGLLAAAYRFCAVFVLMIFVVSTVVREFNDKCMELYLSMPITRALYFVGKTAGFITCAVVIAAIFSATMLIYSDFSDVLLWFVTLSLELVLVALFAFFAALTFNQHVTPGLFITFFFYLLARLSDTIVRISESAYLDDTLGNKLIDFVLLCLYYVLPSLEKFARTDWLMYGADYSGLGLVALQTAIYGTMIGAMGMFDLRRKNL